MLSLTLLGVWGVCGFVYFGGRSEPPIPEEGVAGPPKGVDGPPCLSG